MATPSSAAVLVVSRRSISQTRAASMTDTSPTKSPTLELAKALDRVLERDVLVVGSPPPESRDLDLLARTHEEHAIASWLRDKGFANIGPEWVRFGAGSADVLDLISVAAFGLSEAAVEQLFADAEPLPELRHLRRPAPHHRLLMLSRWTIEGDGTLSDKRRERIAQALAEDPHAWEAAKTRAQAWHALHALAALEYAYVGGSRLPLTSRAAALAESLYAPGRTHVRARLRAWQAVLRRRRTAARVVSFSGLDGAGKTSQIGALQQVLEQLGFDVTLQWTRLEWTTLWENRWLGVLGWPARTILELISRMRTRDTASDGGTPIAPAAVRERSAVISHAWTTIVALAHGLAQRRETRRHLHTADVVVCDRYTLDAAVHLRFRYGEHRNYAFQIRLLDLLSPRPSAAYLVDVPAATAYARKAEQYSLAELDRQAKLYREERARLGVSRLDGELARAEISKAVAEQVWRALRSG